VRPLRTGACAGCATVGDALHPERAAVSSNNWVAPTDSHRADLAVLSQTHERVGIGNGLWSSIGFFMMPGVMNGVFGRLAGIIVPIEKEEDPRNLAILAGIFLLCMIWQMINLGKNRSALQKKLSLYDDEKVNFLLYNPITAICCIPCLVCQVRTSLDLCQHDGRTDGLTATVCCERERLTSDSGLFSA